MKEVLHYETLADGRTRCAVCPHRCLVADGRRGICQVRENQAGKLFALNYNKTIAVHIDPIEKKPLYHFLPGSRVYSFAAAGCNLRCSWCQNWEISQQDPAPAPVEGKVIPAAEHVRQALASRCPSIAATYTEPTIFVEYSLEVMAAARASGLKNIWVSNGFTSPETLTDVLPLLDAANIDFKGPDDAIYHKWCGGQAGPVMDTLVAMRRAGVHIEVTTLVVPGVNDEPEQLERVVRFIAESLGTDTPWHISRFFPAWKMLDTPVTPYATLIQAQAIGQAAGLTHIHLGNV